MLYVIKNYTETYTPFYTHLQQISGLNRQKPSYIHKQKLHCINQHCRLCYLTTMWP